MVALQGWLQRCYMPKPSTHHPADGYKKHEHLAGQTNASWFYAEQYLMIHFSDLIMIENG